MRRHPFPPVAGISNIPVPTCPEQAADNLQMLAESSRRSFMTRGLAMAVPATVLAASSTARAATAKPPLPEFYPGSTQATFVEIAKDEASHVEILIAAIRSVGGTPRPFPTFQNITVSNPTAFLQAAIAFENEGVHAYFGAAPYIHNPSVLGVAVSIAFVEAYHSGFLNRLGNEPLIPGGLTYATPNTIAQVTAAVSPYIVSLNDNGMFPATFSTTPSPQNDIDIMNFALLLEYLEAAYYFYSVPKVYPGSF